MHDNFRFSLEKESYEAVLESVRSGEVFAAVINSDIVRWRQKEIKNGDVPLAIVKSIEMSIPVRGNVIVFGNYSIWDCMNKFSEEIYETPRRKYHKNIEVGTTRTQIGTTNTRNVSIRYPGRLLRNVRSIN